MVHEYPWRVTAAPRPGQEAVRCRGDLGSLDGWWRQRSRPKGVLPQRRTTRERINDSVTHANHARHMRPVTWLISSEAAVRHGVTRRRDWRGALLTTMMIAMGSASPSLAQGTPSADATPPRGTTWIRAGPVHVH